MTCRQVCLCVNPVLYKMYGRGRSYTDSSFGIIIFIINNHNHSDIQSSHYDYVLFSVCWCRGNKQAWLITVPAQAACTVFSPDVSWLFCCINFFNNCCNLYYLEKRIRCQHFIPFPVTMINNRQLTHWSCIQLQCKCHEFFNTAHYIGRFSEAGLLEWMHLVIFCARSCERLQHTSGPISE